MWGFRQDGACSHTDSRAQTWCLYNIKSFIPKGKWPPNSPELKPFDYTTYDRISSEMEYKKVKTINDLCSETRKAVKNIHVKYVRKMIDAFLRRVYHVEKHDGGLVIDEHY